MRPKFLFIICLILSFSSLYAQKSLSWNVLNTTSYEGKSVDDNYLMIPNFSDKLINDFEGKEVIVSGYLVPVDVVLNTYALSQFPTQACFFCGNAGPETAVLLQFSVRPDRFINDKFVSVRGTLVLDRSGRSLFYSLNNAQLSGL